jgi:(p)ppGpp synthase/HD superfamily hydrolase
MKSGLRSAMRPAFRTALRSPDGIDIAPILEAPGNLVAKAAHLATRAHLGQSRRVTGLPYIIHPYRVALLVEANGGTPEQVAAAWCHDVLEDCPAFREILPEIMPPLVMSMVRQLTKPPGTKGEAMRAHLQAMGPDAAMVKLADRIDNLRDAPGAFPEEWIRAYLDEALIVYAVCGGANAHLARILHNTITEMKVNLLHA